MDINCPPHRLQFRNVGRAGLEAVPLFKGRVRRMTFLCLREWAPLESYSSPTLKVDLVWNLAPGRALRELAPKLVPW